MTLSIDSLCPSRFSQLGHNIRQFILKFLPFLDILRLRFLSMQQYEDTSEFMRLQLHSLDIDDPVIMTRYLPNCQSLSRISVHLVGINLLQLLKSLRLTTSIQHIKLSSCESGQLRSNELFVLPFWERIISLSIQVVPQYHNHFGSQLPSRELLNSFWQSRMKKLEKLCIKTYSNSDIVDDLNFALTYNEFAGSLIESIPSIKRLLILKLHNIPLQLLSNQTIENERISVGIGHLNSHPQIQSLKIKASKESHSSFLGMNDQTLTGIFPLLNQKSLRSLRILDFRSVLSKQFSSNRLIEFIQSFPNISVLHLNSYKAPCNISSISLMQIQEVLQNITSLGLASCNKLDSGVMDSFISSPIASSIVELIVDYTQFDGYALMSITRQRIQLRKISISHCQRITKEALFVFFCSSYQLESVAVKKLRCFTKKSLLPLIQNNYRSLVELVMEGNKIDNFNITYLISKATKLKRLTMRKFDRVHPNFNANLFQQYLLAGHPSMQNMVALDLSHNDTFNDIAISNIHKIFPLLESISLDGCPVTQVWTLMKLKKSLKSIRLSGTKMMFHSASENTQTLYFLEAFHYLRTLSIEIQSREEEEEPFFSATYFHKWNNTKPLLIVEGNTGTTVLLEKPKKVKNIVGSA